MIARSSDRQRRPGAPRRPASGVRVEGVLGDRRGAVLAIVALCLVVILGSVGLGLDLGRAYIEQQRLGRAVDAAALAGARSLRDGVGAARAEASAIARANGVANGLNGITTWVTFGTNERGEGTVTVSATRSVPTTFMMILGIDHMDVTANAVAAVPPIDVVLVLDTSGSLGTAGAFDELQTAAVDFVNNFNDQMDQMGLVSFQISAHDRFNLNHNFRANIVQDINLMSSAGDTNIGEGLRKARLQLEGPTARANAAQVVVFFTDGRATAYRGNFGGADRLLAVPTTGNTLRGYFDNPDGKAPFSTASPNGCSGQASCFGLTSQQVRTQAALAGANEARSIRQEGVRIYTIALGNPGATNPLLTPDLDYLKGLSNEDGVTDPDEPRGKSYFAPSALQLRAVFNDVANDLVVRLAG
jgi:Flp pilus assembly protein TadG